MKAPAIGSLVIVLVLAVLTLATPTPSRAATCRADNVLLGQVPVLTGQTSTDWFNVFGFDFDPSLPPTITFGAPVVLYPGETSQGLPPSVTSFVVPTTFFDGSFKLTFRARDSDVRTITARIVGEGCVANTIVQLTLPGTSTDAPATPSLGGLALILLVSLGAAAALWRRLQKVE